MREFHFRDAPPSPAAGVVKTVASAAALVAFVGAVFVWTGYLTGSL